MTSEDLEVNLKCERAALELIHNDIYQVYAAGKSLSQGKDDSSLDQFFAMHESTSTFRDLYLSRFSQCVDLAIRSDFPTLFPTKEDTKKRTEFNLYFYKIIEFYNKLKPQQATPNESVPNASSSNNSSTLNNAILNMTIPAHSRLPVIDLPTFSGSITDWANYKQLYISLIHSNNEIPEIQRFHYLCSTLKGEALKVISAFTISEENYDKAWDALCKRYDNKRLLATTYLEKIFDFSPPSGPSNLASLQNFISSIAENIAAFKSINVPNEADFLWLSIALRKLDADTRKHFEISCINNEWPTFSQLETFIRNRSRILQLANPSLLSLHETPSSVRPSRSSGSGGHVFTTTSSNSQRVCSCFQQHALYECPIFRGKSVGGRKSFLKGRNVCYNCLKLGHVTTSCLSSFRCKICSGKHNTLLHSTDTKKFVQPASTSHQTSNSAPSRSSQGGAMGDNHKSLIASVTGPTQVLLGTALVHILDVDGKPQSVRALIDSGSQFSLVTSSCAKRLGLTWKASNHRPIGAGETPLPRVRGKLKCTIFSRCNPEFQFNIEPLVVASITGKLPPYCFEPPKSHNLYSHKLADPEFFIPGDIDLLLGADLFMSILLGPPFKIDNHYEALPTSLGLIVMGRTNFPSSSSYPEQINCHCVIESPVSDEIFSKFWNLEEAISEPFDLPLDPCEDDFVKNHYREPDGRYVVSLPFKEQPSGLEGSLNLAMRRFNALEVKMEKNPVFKEKYHDFMNEYLTLGHMSLASSRSGYVIPHHGVFKHNDPCGKIRVVFDASAKTINGSLNDKLHAGPNLQRDLSEVILNFRRFPIAVTGDMIKMYRQILMRPEDRTFLHIIWRFNPREPPQIFQLNTVTYGTKPAMFQAKRTIIQLVRDEGHLFPLASQALLEACYVDDIVCGAENEPEALALVNQLTGLLHKGKFEIHKWASNSPGLMQSLNVNNGDLDLSPKDTPATKILGLAWDPREDEFYYKVEVSNYGITKRAILSAIARLFDPVGFLSPSIFMAKTIFQATWKSNKDGKRIDWDNVPEPLIVNQWKNFVAELPQFNNIRIPRYFLSPNATQLQIIGFADASDKGFAAVLYLRCISSNLDVKVSLLKGKTRLAPLNTISIPKLELSAAHLLVKTLLSIKHLINSLKIEEIFLFTDSTIVLSWLNISPHQLQTFVANRVAFILTHTKFSQWFHVVSRENPADIASRGLSPGNLQSSTLWWAGPEWLHLSNWSPQLTPLPVKEVPELRSGVVLLERVDDPELIDWINRFSNYRTLLRVLAYIQRFIYNSKNSNLRRSGPLTVEELNNSQTTCIKITQHHHFRNEFSWVENKPLSKRLQILSAYADELGILRVGGRLTNADLPPETKFPVILTGQCHLTSLLINHLHITNFHMGNLALQSLIRRKFWIFRLRQSIKYRLSKCLICFRTRARPQNPIMGNLPSCRVRPSRPFSHCGVDYAGPFNIKLSSRRNAPTTKSYLCLFICLATRAVHLEVASSLTTEAFLASLERFIARRGKPSYIRSDCGTNFVGAARQLQQLSNWLRNKDVQERVSTFSSDLGIQWSFNPPHAPHFGGIWEAAVKSAKHHLHCIVGDRAFHFEELVTLFAKIEAILNSRPLCAQPDEEHGDVLTPGHFLIGAPLVALPEHDITDINTNRLSRWQLVTNTVQHFWKRWHAEYIQTMQKRPKWYHHSRPLKKGDLVLISDPASSPLQWKTARIEECFPGNDGITRVVSIKDGKGLRKIPVHILVSLSHLCETEVSQI